MKSFSKFFAPAAAAMSVASLITSCSLDAPFGDAAEANLTITTEIRGDVVKSNTRAISDPELANLREQCVVYIENSRGVIRKYKGLDNIPEQIRLQTGDYVAEAWSGDSVSASFDSKFYRGYQKFSMVEGQNSLTLNCNIANVVVSVDPASLDVNLSNLKVTFSHSKGSLEFTSDNIPSAKGYFMMPNADSNINYKIEGTEANGDSFVKEGVIPNVQRAHEYCMTITEDEPTVTEGGALIRISIADIPIIEEEVEVFPAPAVRGVDFNIDQQVVSVDNNFSDTHVYIRGYFGLSSVILNVSDNVTGISSGVNILEGSAASTLAGLGINVERRSSTDAAQVGGGDVAVDELYITFTKAYLDALADDDKERIYSFEATDSRHLVGQGRLRIANTDAAIERLAPIATVDCSSDFLSVGVNKATLSGVIYDTESAANYGIQYRPAGSSAWTTVYPSSSQAAAARRVARATRAGSTPYSVTITGLAEATAYEYRAICDGYDEAVIMSFTTESKFSIVNASFEDWSTYTASTLFGNKSVTLPGSTGDKLTSFWGSGNEGSATANLTLTTGSTDMVHSGTYSARLASNKAMGVLAAGNIFVGHYVRTDGTNGVLSLGREYNGSHPSKVRVYANYRPGTVDVFKDGYGLTNGGLDHGQVYVALTDEPIEIRTNPNDRKLFDPDDTHVLAYGQVTWTENYGPDGQLQLLEIPLNYFERAKTTRATHLVIVASASKFGDYFTGSSSSVMYLDDFELVYE